MIKKTLFAVCLLIACFCFSVDSQPLSGPTTVRERTLMITIAGLFLIIIGLLFSRYRLKLRTNRKLELQQEAIAEQNISLRHLVKEKEWLVKEIHHRVKNNFQTVMGLLGTQSGYLQNEIAINAIRDSQQRIHAMSLIHQKLYQTENLSGVSMPDYVHELVDFLKDSHPMDKCIRFDLRIEPILLDIAHCIPLGLILNEAITNSFKYAFSTREDGMITITFRRKTGDHLLLTIKDNGRGFPPDLDPVKPTSMGMNLMRGLSQEIGAKFSMTSNDGVQISVEFVYDPDTGINITQSKP